MSGAPADPKPLPASKRGLGIDVLTAARQRIRRIFNDFPNVYVSFSGGKDSGIALELAAVEARNRGRRLGVLIVDLEAQYALTIEYIRTMLDRHADVLDVHWVCLPLHLQNAASVHQTGWQSWDPDQKDLWVRPLPEHPGVISDPDFFPFFRRDMEFEEFVPAFGDWYAEQHGGRMTACIVAIRSDESQNRFRTIANRRKVTHEGLQWTTWVRRTGVVWNCYPIYDWRTADDWTYYGKENVPYNRVYDLMYKAGLTIHQARLCQPYGQDQRKGLWLFQIIEPDTWTRVVARVQGANFAARYARETGNILGQVKVTKPDSLTWQQYSLALLNSMPPITAEDFRTRIAWFIAWHTKNTPGCEDGQIPDDGPLDRKNPSWRRICKVVLSGDIYCRALTFSPPASHDQFKEYKKRVAIKRLEWQQSWDTHAV